MVVSGYPVNPAFDHRGLTCQTATRHVVNRPAGRVPYPEGTGRVWELSLAATVSRKHMVLKRSMARLPTGLSVSTAWLGALGLSCLSLGCARTADERVLAISRLLEEARSFQAEQYAPEAFQRAEDLLSRTRRVASCQSLILRECIRDRRTGCCTIRRLPCYRCKKTRIFTLWTPDVAMSL